MQSNNRLFDDIARLANGAMGVAAGFRAEVEGMIKARLTAMLHQVLATPPGAEPEPAPDSVAPS